MAAALDAAQQEFVTAEINRRLEIFNQATTASLQAAVEASRASAGDQFAIEKREFDGRVQGDGDADHGDH